MGKYKIFIIIFVIVCAAIIAGTYFTVSVVRERTNLSLIENYKAQELVLAKNIAKTLEAEVNSTINDLLLMGTHPAIVSGKADECHEKIKEELALIKSGLGNVGRVDKDGNFRCSLNAALVGTKAANLGPYITDIFNDPDHKPVLSRVLQVPGAPSPLVAIHVPVKNKGVFDGTLGGALYLHELQEKYLKNITFAKRGYAILFDDDGLILYHPRPESIGTSMRTSTSTNAALFLSIIEKSNQGEEGTFEYIHQTEGKKVASYEPVKLIPGRTWTVVVTVPTDDAHEEIQALGIDNLLNRIWWLVGGLVVLIGTIAIAASYKYVFLPIKQIQEMKSDFVSLVSHQLKTPVAQIKGFSENMLEGLVGPVTDRQKEYLRDMIHVATNNSKLIDDLLNVSRIERGMLKVEKSPLSISEIMESALSLVRGQAEYKGVKLVEQIPATSAKVIGDPVKTKEAIRNIVDNAVKFTDAGKSVTVIEEEENNYIKITIADEGGGIDPDVQKELFEKNRVWAGKVKSSGAGLGLFLAKQFIEKTDGIITYTTAPGKGTTFVIQLKKA